MGERLGPESVHQRFAYGLRFLTELEYRVTRTNGRRAYRRLLREPSPLVPHPGDEGGGWTCASLAVAVLSEAKVKPIQDMAVEEAQSTEPIVGALSRLLPGHGVRVSGPQMLLCWGGIAHSALDGCGIGMVQWTVKDRVRWSLVVGAQWCSTWGSPHGSPLMQRPSLLLWDGGLDPVWGIGRNASLGLAEPCEVGTHGTAPLVLRTLDGGHVPVGAGVLITVEPRRNRQPV